MPNILILGASGLIGFSLAQSLLRSGNHTVVGLVRRSGQTSILMQNEIYAVCADAGNEDALKRVIEERRIDVVVDAASAYEHAGLILDVVKQISEKRLREAGEWVCPKLGFVYVSLTELVLIMFWPNVLSVLLTLLDYQPRSLSALHHPLTVHPSHYCFYVSSILPRQTLCLLTVGIRTDFKPWQVSGVWVHGSPFDQTSDRILVGHPSNPSAPASATSWRPAHEQRILASRDVLDVAIVRPSQVYGKGSWIFDTWWSPLLEAQEARKQGKGNKDQPTIQIPVSKEARTAVIHVDDVAAALHAAIDQIEGRLGNWPVFDLVAETIRTTEIIEAAMPVFDLDEGVEVQYVGTGDNPFFQAMGVRSNLDGARATTVLGWTPKRREFLLGIGKYIMAWKAARKEKKAKEEK